jgi:hypothetical protein
MNRTYRENAGALAADDRCTSTPALINKLPLATKLGQHRLWYVVS